MNNILKIQTLIESGDLLTYRGKAAKFKTIDNRGTEYEFLVEIDGTPTKFIKRDEKAIDLWMLNFKPIAIDTDNDRSEALIPKLPAVQKHESPDLYFENKPMLEMLTQALMDDVKKLKTDPTYIPQAKAISNSVNTFIQLAKIQLQLSKGV